MANRWRDGGSAQRGTPHAGRTAWGIGFVISGLFMMISPPWADGAVVPAAPVAPSKISIQQSFTGTDAGCLPASLGMTFTTTSSDTSFVLNVITNVRPCEPIAATAAIYAMPGNGVAWPQTLVETKSFTVDRVGVTTITFAKTCAPAQFDVVTGPTPQVIDPLGASHGPLLIPDIASAQQWWGRPCVDPTSTVPTSTVPTTTIPATTTTTTTVGATSTTVPGATTSTVPSSTSTTVPSVTSTTVNLVANSTTTTIGAAVEGATANRTGSSGVSSSPSSGGGSAVSGSGLAVTGSSIALAIAAGLAQVAIGAALIISARRIVR